MAIKGTTSRVTFECFASGRYWLIVISLHACVSIQMLSNTQEFGLKKIARSQKVPNHEILGAQHLHCKVKKASFPSCLKVRVSCLWHLGSPIAQPCIQLQLRVLFKTIQPSWIFNNNLVYRNIELWHCVPVRYTVHDCRLSRGVNKLHTITYSQIMDTL